MVHRSLACESQKVLSLVSSWDEAPVPVSRAQKALLHQTNPFLAVFFPSQEQTSVTPTPWEGCRNACLVGLIESDPFPTWRCAIAHSWPFNLSGGPGKPPLQFFPESLLPSSRRRVGRDCCGFLPSLLSGHAGGGVLWQRLSWQGGWVGMGGDGKHQHRHRSGVVHGCLCRLMHFQPPLKLKASGGRRPSQRQSKSLLSCKTACITHAPHHVPVCSSAYSSATAFTTAHLSNTNKQRECSL